MNTCPACGNQHGNEFLGTLGGAEWNRCRACGAITTPAPVDEPTQAESHPLKRCTPEEYQEALGEECTHEEFETHQRSIIISYGRAGEIVAIARYEVDPPFAATIRRWSCNAK